MKFQKGEHVAVYDGPPDNRVHCLGRGVVVGRKWFKGRYKVLILYPAKRQPFQKIPNPSAIVTVPESYLEALD